MMMMKVLPGPTRSPRRRGEGDRRPLRTHPGRSALVFVLALLAAVAIPIAGVWGVRTIASSKEGDVTVRSVPGDSITELVLPDTAGALLVVVDPEDAVVGLTVLAPATGGRGGTALVIPTTTAVTGADGAEVRLGDAYASGGLEAQTGAVESLLGVTLATSLEVGEAELARLLEDYGPFSVLFTDRVVDTQDGGDETISEAADRDLTARDAAAVLVARKQGESELARLPRTTALWEQVVGDDPTATATFPAGPVLDSPTTVPERALTTVPEFLAAVAAGSGTVQRLPVTARRAPDGGELFDVPAEYIHLLMAQVLPGAVSPVDDDARVRLIEPGADPSTLLAATAALDALPANLILASSGGQAASPAATVLSYGTPVGEAAARAMAAAGTFGPAPTIVAAEQRFEGIDLTITVGEDFAPAVAAYEAAAPVTSPPPDTDQDEED